jgi:hypothetical protein
MRIPHMSLGRVRIYRIPRRFPESHALMSYLFRLTSSIPLRNQAEISPEGNRDEGHQDRTRV